MLLAKRGANIVVNYVSDGSRERAEKVAKEVEASGAKAIVVKADVSKTEEVPKLVDAALKISTTGQIEILIHKYVPDLPPTYPSGTLILTASPLPHTALPKEMKPTSWTLPRTFTRATLTPT